MRLTLDTGFPRADVENDFLRARRRQFLATLGYRHWDESANPAYKLFL